MHYKTKSIQKRKPTTSLLRYPGSKKRLASYIEEVLRINELNRPLFIELFAGGANVSLYLLQNELVDSIGLIERDPLVASFWQTVFSNNEEDFSWLVQQIMTIEITLQKWSEFKGKIPDSIRERALACLFLNRTSFSGILAPSSGPIGGYTQKSDYKIDCRFPREKIIKRLEQIAQLKNRVKFVWDLDWKEGLARVQNMQNAGDLTKNAFFYLDPPFFRKADRLYTYYFTYKEHENLRDTVLSLREPWLLSYDYCDEAKKLYGDTIFSCVELLYSVSQNGGSRSVQEVIFTNQKKLPGEMRLWRTTKEWKKDF